MVGGGSVGLTRSHARLITLFRWTGPCSAPVRCAKPPAGSRSRSSTTGSDGSGATWRIRSRPDSSVRRDRPSSNFTKIPTVCGRPLIKENGSHRPATWEEAFALIANRFDEIVENTRPLGPGHLRRQSQRSSTRQHPRHPTADQVARNPQRLQCLDRRPDAKARLSRV